MGEAADHFTGLASIAAPSRDRESRARDVSVVPLSGVTPTSFFTVAGRSPWYQYGSPRTRPNRQARLAGPRLDYLEGSFPDWNATWWRRPHLPDIARLLSTTPWGGGSYTEIVI